MKCAVYMCASVFAVACDSGVDPGSWTESEPPVGEGPSVELPVRLQHFDGALPGAAAVLDPLDPHADLPFLVSRFGPAQGLVGTRVTILTAFDPSGCDAARACSVTIGGVRAEVADDTHVLEVFVPIGAESGPLCLSLGERSECGGDFTVLPAPLVYSVSPGRVPAGSGDVVVQVDGDGFFEDAELIVAWESLVTNVESAYRLTAIVPARLFEVGGELPALVYVPSAGRCGARSEPFTLLVD